MAASTQSGDLDIPSGVTITHQSGSALVLEEGSTFTLQRLASYDIAHDDFTAAATSESVDLTPTLPPGVYFFQRTCTVAFVAPASSAGTLNVGVSGGNIDLVVDDEDVHTGTIAYGMVVGDGGGAWVTLTSTTTLAALLTLTDDDVADTTAGAYRLDVYGLAAPSDPDA